MEERRRVYDLFLRMTAPRVPTARARTAHVAFYRGTLSPGEELVAMTKEDVEQALKDELFDVEQEPVRWFLQQLSTYDYETERLVGLVFEDGMVLSDVLRVAPGTTGCRH